MFIKTSVALLMVFLIIPISAHAWEPSGTTTSTSVQDFNESERNAIFQEIKVVFANAQISVRDVIKIAEARVRGPRL